MFNFNEIEYFILKISPTVTEILTFNKNGLPKFTVIQKRSFLRTIHRVDADVSINAIVALAKQKKCVQLQLQLLTVRYYTAES